MFWNPGICPAVIPAQAEPLTGRSGFCLGALPGSVSLLRHRSGLQHVLIRHGGHALQLAIAGADVRRPVRLVTDLVHDRAVSGARIDAIARFNRLCHRGRIGPPRLKAQPGAYRLRLVLQALDGFLDELPQREIAERMFGEARVRRDWRDASENLRDCVRRAIHRGRRLMEGDYRLLLR